MTLAPAFPEVPPTIAISPPVLHAWVNAEQFVVGHEKLINWSPHNMIGKIIKDIFHEFLMRHPRKIDTGSIQAASSVMASASSNSSMGVFYSSGGSTSATGSSSPLPLNKPALPPSPAQSGGGTDSSGASSVGPGSMTLPRPPPRPSHSPIIRKQIVPPPYPFAELSTKSFAELEQLVNDDAKFLELFENMESVKNAKTLVRELSSANEALARKNLEKEGVISSLKREINEETDVLEVERSEYKAMRQDYDAIMKNFSPEVVLEKVKHAVDEAEAESESIADMFLSGSIDHEEFLRVFKEKRKLYHIRASKYEKLKADPSSLRS